jgi:hypothetical protein
MVDRIEFWGKIEDGVIRLPAEYLGKYTGLDAKILVMAKPNLDLDLEDKKMRLKLAFAKISDRNIFQHISDPVRWQKSIRDEWE